MRNNGSRVQVWDCNGQPQQQWSFSGNALVNAGGKCLDIHAPDMRNNGSRVQVWDCNGQPQQQWRF
ncbi:ricin-type beta-trefoil lectin domain protein [Microcystis aeruginosa]|uniref:ricin-type beta-trefoil lectin domain protein n=1 Tax=Microcystis aeruginosa TaxID=1126 RepID=UPI003D18D35F